LCEDHGDLLPSNLPGSTAKNRELPIRAYGGGGAGGGLSAMLALPARELA
jgi:hypothetical protein